MANLSIILYRFAGWRYAFAGFLGILVFNLVVFANAGKRIDASGAEGPLDLRFGFTPDEAYQALTSYGESGRQIYVLTETTADVIYPLAYTLFFVALLGMALRAAFPDASPWRRLNLIPLLTLICDYLENTGILAMLIRFPDASPGWAQFASMFQMGKWIALVSGLLLILLATAKWLLKRKV